MKEKMNLNLFSISHLVLRMKGFDIESKYHTSVVLSIWLIICDRSTLL